MYCRSRQVLVSINAHLFRTCSSVVVYVAAGDVSAGTTMGLLSIMPVVEHVLYPDGGNVTLPTHVKVPSRTECLL
ncbi:hypothetical protein BDZ85DRAFT_265551 [Elsinoe ampelina]|uniref:Uncharacterized protein n=1 Tax=Elsinoe ampelina TaxID=302913 RepID=A0A6A6G762_9PEZI|nr:hypothetical protein BDZ85DRAFT_265551 [Elsinoe ampelina]